MHPVEVDEAAVMYARSLALIKRDGSCSDFEIVQLNVEDSIESAATHWLRQHQPNFSTSVILSWDKDIALRTTWGIFTSYWDDFCYPMSDDLVVWPEDEKWVLLYHHEERFYFGTRPA